MNLLDETQNTGDRSFAARLMQLLRKYFLVVTLLGMVFLFIFYINRVSTTPPGFYIDECAISYNAYCIAHTGANEFGDRFPLFIPVYTSGWRQFANPTQIYLLAIPFTVFRPSIRLARVFSATWV